jgi:hypothetical protein
VSDPLEIVPRVDRTKLEIVSVQDDDNDVAYWHSRTPEERWLQMEILRRINYGSASTGRLQRVLEVARRE